MRFRLKTLLFAGFLFALATLFYLAPMIRRWEVEARIERMDAGPVEVIYDTDHRPTEFLCRSPNQPKDDSTTPIELEFVSQLGSLRKIELIHRSFKSLAPLADLPNLETLEVYACEFEPCPDLTLSVRSMVYDGNLRLNQLPKLPYLTSLQVGTMRAAVLLFPTPEVEPSFSFSWAGASKQLKSLTVVQESIVDMQGLESLPELDILDLQYAAVFSIDGIDKQSKSLEQLMLGPLFKLSDSPVAFADQKYYLPETRDPTEHEIECLCRCQSLKELSLSNLWPRKVAKRIQAALPHCKVSFGGQWLNLRARAEADRL